MKGKKAMRMIHSMRHFGSCIQTLLQQVGSHSWSQWLPNQKWRLLLELMWQSLEKRQRPQRTKEQGEEQEIPVKGYSVTKRNEKEARQKVYMVHTPLQQLKSYESWMVFTTAKSKVEKYSSLFRRLGKLEDDCQLKLKPGAIFHWAPQGEFQHRRWSQWRKSYKEGDAGGDLQKWTNSLC